MIDKKLVRAHGRWTRRGSWARCHGGRCRGTRASGVQHLRPGEWKPPESDIWDAGVGKGQCWVKGPQ